MKAGNINQDDFIQFATTFDLQKFCNDRDYRNNNWFIKKDWEIMVLEFFRLDENCEEFLFLEKLLKTVPCKFYLSGFPISIGDTNTHFTNESNFKSFLKKEDNDYIKYITFILHTEGLYIIFEVDLELIFIGYNAKFKKTVEDIYKNYKWKYNYKKYIEHINDLREKGFIW